MATGDELAKITAIVKNINDFKTQIAQLDLEPRARTYYDYETFPLLNLLYKVENESGNYGISAKDLALVFSKSDIKLAKKLTMDIIEKSEEEFKILKDKIDILNCIEENI